MSACIDGQDDLNKGLDNARAVWLALHVPNLLTEDMITALANTLNDAINALDEAKGKFSTYGCTVGSVDNGEGRHD